MKLIDIINNSLNSTMVIKLCFYYKGIKVESAHMVSYFLECADDELLESKVEIISVNDNQLTLELK